MKNINTILDDIKRYYTNKLHTYGTTPKGVDWKDENSQILRLEKLLLVIRNTNEKFSINDIGCGYGVLYEILKNQCLSFDYYGYDISNDMVNEAKKKYGKNKDCYFEPINTLYEVKTNDYSVASGIFNVKMDYDESDWLYYILKSIDIINQKSKIGFSFNILTKYSDKEYMRKDLYYADPCFLFDYCKRNFSRNVSLLHDYDLYEFTIIVKK